MIFHDPSPDDKPPLLREPLRQRPSLTINCLLQSVSAHPGIRAGVVTVACNRWLVALDKISSNNLAEAAFQRRNRR